MSTANHYVIECQDFKIHPQMVYRHVWDKIHMIYERLFNLCDADAPLYLSNTSIKLLMGSKFKDIHYTVEYSITSFFSSV